MIIRQTPVTVVVAVLLCLVLSFPSWTAAASADEASFKLTEQSLANLREEGLPQDALEKLQYDLYFVKNHSLFLDVLILLQTAEVVLFGRGAR